MRHSAGRIFCSDVAQPQQNGGLNANGAASMHQSTWVVLLLLMFGEIAVLALVGFILWLAGEFGDDTPGWARLRGLRKRRRAQGRQGLEALWRPRVIFGIGAGATRCSSARDAAQNRAVRLSPEATPAPWATDRARGS